MGELSMEAAQISLPAGIHDENDFCLFVCFVFFGGGGGLGLAVAGLFLSHATATPTSATT